VRCLGWVTPVGPAPVAGRHPAQPAPPGSVLWVANRTPAWPPELYGGRTALQHRRCSGGPGGRHGRGEARHPARGDADLRDDPIRRGAMAGRCRHPRLRRHEPGPAPPGRLAGQRGLPGRRPPTCTGGAACCAVCVPSCASWAPGRAGPSTTAGSSPSIPASQRWPPARARGICELLESRAFRPLIDRRYRLEEIVEAYRYVEMGQKIGNVVIGVEPSRS
jgi:hypothetical protein